MDNNMIGKILGERYEILEVIGSGGMAVVYKARCKLLNRFVAVKVLKEHLKTDTEVVKRFSTESRAAASLSHHNIVSVYDVGETPEGLNYIVMEYVDGVTLKRYIEGKGRLGWGEACQLAYQIAMALQCAHENGIVHRDIKPHNILLTRDRTLKVADFGIARTTGSDTVIASGNNGVLGSVHYISPEQARGGYVDARSDVYSLGVVLYEMLSGKVPFDGENPVSVALMKLENEPKDIRDTAVNIPDSVAAVVMKAISKDQGERYMNAAAMAYDLKEILDGSDVTMAIHKRTTQKKQTKKTKNKKSNTTSAVIVMSVILAVLFGVGAYFFFYGGGKEYQVPDLMNMTLEEAIELAQKEGFKIEEENITYEESDEFEEGTVMNQDPGANSFVKKREIKLVISIGENAGDIEVPNVVGYDYEKAKDVLKKANLKYKKIEEDSDEDENTVIRQSPKQGTMLGEGYEVILYVSNGKGKASPTPTETNKLTPVPKLEGEDYEDASDILKKSNLKLGNVSKEESDKPAGTIISQNPKSGSESPEGSYVNIVVSSGKKVEATPTHTATTKPSSEDGELKKKTFTILLPQTESGSVHVKVVANGKTIHDKTHSSSEGEIDIPVASKKDATVEVYFDGELKHTQVVKF